MLVACGSSDDDPSASSLGPAASAQVSTTTSAASTSGSAPGSTSTTSGAKPGVGVEKAVDIPNPVAAAGTPIAFTATFRPTVDATFELDSEADAGIDLQVDDPPTPLRVGQTTEVPGTVTAADAVQGTARITVTVDPGADGPGSATSVTLFVAASDGWVAVGSSSRSEADRLLLDTLLDQGVIDEAEHARRVEQLTGGT